MKIFEEIFKDLDLFQNFELKQVFTKEYISIILPLVYILLVILVFFLGKRYGLRYKKYTKMINAHNQRIKSVKRKIRILNVVKNRFVSFAKWSMFFVLILYGFELKVNYEKNLKIGQEEFLKTAQTLDFSFYFCILAGLFGILSSVIFSKFAKNVQKTAKNLENQQNEFVSKMLGDLGNELRSALKEYFIAGILSKIDRFNILINNSVIEIQTLRAKATVLDKRIEVFGEFFESFKEDFCWCENCVNSCLEFENEKDKIDLDNFCFKNCKARYYLFMEKIELKLKENLMKVEVMDKKLMEDAEKIGNIGEEEVE